MHQLGLQPGHEQPATGRIRKSEFDHERTSNTGVTLPIKNSNVRMTNQNTRSEPAAPEYSWKCLACDSGNSRGATSCSACGCPALATLHEIERFRPVEALPAQKVQQQNEAHRAAMQKALAGSRYSYWYWASIGAFVFSLLVPNGSGLYMLVTGWAALQFSLAWFANPLLISAFVLGRPTGEPGSWRGLVYGALVMMFIQPADSFAEFWPLPIFPWLASALLLLIGVEVYRAMYRQALSTPVGIEDSRETGMSA